MNDLRSRVIALEGNHEGLSQRVERDRFGCGSSIALMAIFALMAPSLAVALFFSATVWAGVIEEKEDPLRSAAEEVFEPLGFAFSEGE